MRKLYWWALEEDQYSYELRLAEIRQEREGVGGANTVASLTQEGKHAAVLDVDRRAELTEGGVLWVDARAGWRGWWEWERMCRVMQRAGLARAERWRESFWREWSGGGEEVYEEARKEVVDETRLCEALLVLGPEMGEIDLEGVVEVARTTGAERGVREGVRMRAPRRVVLEGEVVLLPSSAHLHLYLEKEVEWERFREVLGAMVRAGVLERKWVRFCLRARMTMVRLPWVRKHHVLDLRI